MSFREKSAWISFVSILVVFGAYFWNANRILQGAVETHRGFVISVGLLAAFVLIEIVLHVTVAMQAPEEALAPKDEREQLIELKATRVAFQVLVVGALAGVAMMHITRSVWVMGQHVLLAIVFAELVKFGVQIRYFRGGV
jgi:archaellum biogenesis protein FlaJ (TadC family)